MSLVNSLTKWKTGLNVPISYKLISTITAWHVAPNWGFHCIVTTWPSLVKHFTCTLSAFMVVKFSRYRLFSCDNSAKLHQIKTLKHTGDYCIKFRAHMILVSFLLARPAFVFQYHFSYNERFIIISLLLSPCAIYETVGIDFSFWP